MKWEKSEAAGKGWETGPGWAPEVSCAEQGEDAIASRGVRVLVARERCGSAGVVTTERSGWANVGSWGKLRWTG